MKDVDVLISGGANVTKALELFGDMQTYDDTLDVFLKEVPDKLMKLKSYKEVGDMANYAIYAHSLKTDARYFGFEKLGDMSYDHELKAKENEPYYIYDHYDELILEANRVVNVCKRYMGENVPLESQPLNVASNISSGKQTVLVVDDSEIIRSFLKKILESDYDVILANNGKETIEILESPDSGKISAMLLDIYMPEVDGFQILEYFKEKNLFYKIPVSIITGNDVKEHDDKAFAYPIVDMIKKPFNEVNIKNIVERTINYNK